MKLERAHDGRDARTIIDVCFEGPSTYEELQQLRLRALNSGPGIDLSEDQLAIFDKAVSLLKSDSYKEGIGHDFKASLYGIDFTACVTPDIIVETYATPFAQARLVRSLELQTKPLEPKGYSPRFPGASALIEYTR